VTVAGNCALAVGGGGTVAVPGAVGDGRAVAVAVGGAAVAVSVAGVCWGRGVGDDAAAPAAMCVGGNVDSAMSVAGGVVGVAGVAMGVTVVTGVGVGGPLLATVWTTEWISTSAPAAGC
jgi:hypothetical protein